jgi:hypothetical protein
VAVYSVGEILHASASWELSYELAPTAQASEYQSVFTSGLALGAVIAPVVITDLLLRFGGRGWVLLGAMMAVLGCAHLAFAGFSSPRASFPLANRREPRHRTGRRRRRRRPRPGRPAAHRRRQAPGRHRIRPAASPRERSRS